MLTRVNIKFVLFSLALTTVVAGTVILPLNAQQENDPLRLPSDTETEPAPSADSSDDEGRAGRDEGSDATDRTEDPRSKDFQSRHEPVFRIRETSSELKIIEKFATVVESQSRITSVDGFDPDVVDVTALAPDRIRVQGVKKGVTTLVLEDEFGRNWSLEVFVSGDVRHLQAYLNQLFPQAAVEAVEVEESVVLRGWVTQAEHITEMIEVAQEFYPKVHNQIKVGGVQQVQLHVKVLEVQRTKIRRLGMNFLIQGETGYLASTPGSLTPLASIGGLSVDPLSIRDSTLTFGVINPTNAFNGFVQALRDEGLLKIMAEPTLTTTNGHPATLLNGGEFPILVPSGLGTVGVEFREFGVRMEAVPMILGQGRLRLELTPEVSERDFANAINVNGITVPGLTVRRAQTQVEMRFGETLMIAGLISRRHTASTSKVPVLGELPWIGTAFSRKQFDEVETELVILVTPEFVAPINPARVPKGGPGFSTTVPLDRELFIDQMLEVPSYGEPCEGCLPGPLSPTGSRKAPDQRMSPNLPSSNGPLIPPAPQTGTKPESAPNPFNTPVFKRDKPGLSEPSGRRPPISGSSQATSTRNGLIAPVDYRKEYAFPGTVPDSASVEQQPRKTDQVDRNGRSQLRTGLLTPSS